MDTYTLVYMVRETELDPEEIVIILSPGEDTSEYLNEGFKEVERAPVIGDLTIWPCDRPLVP